MGLWSCRSREVTGSPEKLLRWTLWSLREVLRWCLPHWRWLAVVVLALAARPIRRALADKQARGQGLIAVRPR